MRGLSSGALPLLIFLRCYGDYTGREDGTMAGRPLRPWLYPSKGTYHEPEDTTP